MPAHRSWLVGALCAVAAVAGCASPSTIENAFGNTLVITMPNGRVARYYFDEDGRYAVQTGLGQLVQGSYEVDGDVICRTPDEGERACAHFESQRRLGEQWRQQAPDGTIYEVRLQRGRP